MSTPRPSAPDSVRDHPDQHILDDTYLRILARASELTAPLQPQRSPSIIGLVRTAEDKFLTILSIPSEISHKKRLSVQFRLTAEDGSPISSLNFSAGIESALRAHEISPEVDSIEAPAAASPSPRSITEIFPASYSIYYSLASFNITPPTSEEALDDFRRVFPFFLSGFMKTDSGRIRVYLTYYDDRATIAVELPIAEDDDSYVKTASTSILGELAPLLRGGIPDNIAEHEVDSDPYCSRAFDLFTWFLGSTK